MDLNNLKTMNVDAFIQLLKQEENFPKYNNLHLLFELRKSLFEFMISRKSEDSYMDISKYRSEDIKQLQEELSQAGWLSALSYGDTGLFIYRKDKPASCW
jgi:hypothetical protein